MVDMPVTEQQARAIAFLALAARPVGAPRWDEAGIYANVLKVRDRNLGSVTIAAIQAAEDRGAISPGVIPKPGPHWRAPEAGPVHDFQPWNKRDFCGICSKHQDRHATAEHPFTPAANDQQRAADASNGAARARAALRQQPQEQP